jgi:hypothetical protein
MSRFEKCFAYTVLRFAVPYGTYLCTFNTSLMEWFTENIVGIAGTCLAFGAFIYTRRQFAEAKKSPSSHHHLK